MVLLRRSASADVIASRVKWLGIAENVVLHDGNLTDLSSLIRILQKVRPAEVYNLAAQSFVKSSWQQPILTGNVTGMGTVNMLEALRISCPDVRFYQASSSEMFGRVQETLQSERTPFYPRCPYAVAKLYAHWMTVNYRECFGCIPRAAFCSLTNRPWAELSSLPARLPTALQELSWVNRNA